MKTNGLITVRSPYSVEETIKRFENTLKVNDVNIFAKIDHAKNAKQANLNLNSTYVNVFGAPHIGTLLMQENQQFAIDLPSKVLIWQDTDDKVWLSRNQTSWLMKRHNINENTVSQELEKKIEKMVKDTLKG